MRGLITYNDGTKNIINDADGLSKFLDKHSEIWKNRTEDEEVTIILHSCRAGQCDRPEDSFLDDLAFSDEFEDVKLIGADSFVWANDDGEIGTYDAIKNEDGEYKQPRKRGEMGNCRVKKNGIEIESYSGDWKPKEKPTLLDYLFKRKK